MKNNQQNKILELLRQMGPIGVNSHDLTYIYSIKQAPTRIKELRQQGYNITSSKLHKNRSVTYVLSNSLALNRTIEPIIQPQYTPEEMLVPVKKTFLFNGKMITRICYEEPEKVKPVQEALL